VPSMNARGAASKTSTSCSFLSSWRRPPCPPPKGEGKSGRLAPRWDQAPKRRIFKAQPPNTDSFQPVLVHQGQLEPQRVGALDPQLVVHAERVVAKVHLFLGAIEGRRGTVSL